MIYFDNAASTKPHPEALRVMNEVAALNYANPSALHSGGIEAEKLIIAAKKQILAKLPPFQISRDSGLFFTSGATESNNIAIFGVCERHGTAKRIVTSTLEHPSVSEPVNELEKRGFEVIRLSPRKGEGKSFEDAVISAADENTALVSVTALHNETGFIIDTLRIHDGIKRKNPSCVFHTDAAQGFLRTPVNADLISLSAHKIHGLKGSGALYVKDGKRLRLRPLFYGGGQQNGLRPGTESTELIAAFGAAAGLGVFEREHFTQLSDYAVKLLSALDSVVINSRDNYPAILNFSARGIKSEVLLHYFAENDIYVSSGSACARGKKSGSLGAFTEKESDIDSAVRLSFSYENTTDEIERFAEILKAGIARFRK